MPVYNKLVRDRIPEILKENGKHFSLRSAKDKDEYVSKLKEKLTEEVNEFLDNPCVEELADIQEVLDALTHNVGATPIEVIQVKEAKARDRGAFFNGYILESVDED